jgi:glutamine---fructose-6-phosphate transaminase (isomerizing)
MCGIFGFAAATPRRRANLKRLRAIARDTESRGRHAFGFAWIDGANRIHAYKQTGAIGQNLDTLEQLADAKLLIGHCRWATHGSPIVNANNHPHAAGDGYVVHNGVIRSYREINQRYRLRPSTECDSETLAMLLGVLNGTHTERLAGALETIDPPAAVAALWPNDLYLARNGNPLSIGRTEAGVYFASYGTRLPDQTKEVPDRVGLRLRFVRNRLELRTVFELSI